VCKYICGVSGDDGVQLRVWESLNSGEMGSWSNRTIYPTNSYLEDVGSICCDMMAESRNSGARSGIHC
jgi:hypothetical protein